jgi:hypothetical protein
LLPIPCRSNERKSAEKRAELEVTLLDELSARCRVRLHGELAARQAHNGHHAVGIAFKQYDDLFVAFEPRRFRDMHSDPIGESAEDTQPDGRTQGLTLDLPLHVDVNVREDLRLIICPLTCGSRDSSMDDESSRVHQFLVT